MAKQTNEQQRYWEDSAAPGYLKAGLQGRGKSGKTFSGALLACAAREVLSKKGPIAGFDTETGLAYVRPAIVKVTGMEPLIKRARGFNDLLAFGQRCLQDEVGAALVDSITHPWRSLCEAFLADVNAKRARSKYKDNRPFDRLQWYHWGPVKRLWAPWTEFYLNSPLSIVACGRAGFEYELDEDKEDDSRGKELVKTGVKMLAESEFAFEPSLLVQFDREQEETKGGGFQIVRRATVLGDRFQVMDGKTTTFPSADLAEAYQSIKKFFEPHLSLLVGGSHVTVKTEEPRAAVAPATPGVPAAPAQAGPTLAAQWQDWLAAADLPDLSHDRMRELLSAFGGQVPMPLQRAWYGALERGWLEVLAAAGPEEAEEIERDMRAQWGRRAPSEKCLAALAEARKRPPVEFGGEAAAEGSGAPDFGPPTEERRDPERLLDEWIPRIAGAPTLEVLEALAEAARQAIPERIGVLESAIANRRENLSAPPRPHLRSVPGRLPPPPAPPAAAGGRRR